jgi:hypothetical protein
MPLFPSNHVISPISENGLLVRVLYNVIAAPIAEELLFRGIVFNRLNSWTPTWFSVLASSVLFGAMHLDLLQGLVSSVTGVMLVLIYLRYRNLWLPIFGHIAGNLAAITLYEISRATGGVYAIHLLIPSAIMLIISIWLLLRYTTPATLLPNADLSGDKEVTIVS